MTRLSERLATAALVVVLVLAYGCEQRKRGAAEALTATIAKERDSLARASRRIDTVYRRDTMRLTRWRDSVVTLRDSLTLTDTVEVVRFIAVQDSTIAACSVALTTCEERVAVRDRQLDAWRRQWEARPKPPSALAKWTERIGWGLAGFGLGRVAPR